MSGVGGAWARQPFRRRESEVSKAVLPLVREFEKGFSGSLSWPVSMSCEGSLCSEEKDGSTASRRLLVNRDLD